ncbi:MAG: hypothetical protein Q8M03_14385 [Legionella sp.]|nr:hypothetical protein [Legionella sp.]
MKVSETLNSDEILLFMADFLKDIHKVNDIKWDSFISPFLFSFVEYINLTERNFEKLQEINSIVIPYGNNDFIKSLERKEYFYDIIKKGKLCKNKEVKIAKPCDEYIKNYIFPYSSKSKIAFLSFPNKIEKLIYYLISFFNIKPCKLSWIQEEASLIHSTERDVLAYKLTEKFGLDKKDIFDLLSFLMPTIYIENFKFFYEKAKDESDKLKEIKTIFFIRHFIHNPTFLILLCLDSQKNKRLITYQHGGGYGQVEPTWSEKVEKKISTHFLTWGYAHDVKDILFYSLRFKKNFIPNIKELLVKKNKNGILIVLSLLIHKELYNGIKNSFEIFSLIKKSESDSVFVRFDPREKDKDYVISILDSMGISYNIDNSSLPLSYTAYQYRTVIFVTPKSTGYLELINKKFYPLMIFHEKDFAIKKESVEIYYKMKNKNVWIDYDNIESADLNKINSEQKIIMKEFKNRFVRTSFFPAIRLSYFLLKSRGNKSKLH